MTTNGVLNGVKAHNTVSTDIQQTFAKIGQLYKKITGPVQPDSIVQPNNDPLPANGDLLADLAHIGFKDVETLLTSFYAQAKGEENDNNLLLEHLVALLAKLPEGSKVGKDLTDGFINQLWGGLPHPPPTSLGSKYKYRTADGSYNNINAPDVGRAFTPYARSAKPEVLQDIGLPDEGAIFDSLMARGENFVPHPNKISSMLFYQATIIIHDLFRTDHVDYTQSNTSSYLDLSPLYGSDWHEQKEMRTFKDGKIKKDCFSEGRILGFPPGVGALLIMYNRYHNYIVEQLAAAKVTIPQAYVLTVGSINENGRFTKPKDDASDKAWEKYDNDLFQTGRLINCGLYVNIILKDYVRTILSLNRTNSAWDLDPRSIEVKKMLNSHPAAEGCGNQVSAEFNLIYRWHSAISEKDDQWTQDAYRKLFPGKNPKDVSLDELLGVLKAMEMNMPKDPVARPFANLVRKDDGTFEDEDLVTILKEGIEDVAGSFGANCVPDIMRSVDILGIRQARAWNLASLNEFRKFFQLTPHATFEDINPDPVVAGKLRDLYGSPDLVELYPGLVAEKAKPPMSPGSGLCVNFTISRAILSDAVALVRGDRFFTVDYHPKNLTNFGFAEVAADTTVDQGCCIYKLFYRAFPDYFKGNSIYAHFPFVIPSENRIIQEQLGTADKYDWEEPKLQPALIEIKSYKAAVEILDDSTAFKTVWNQAIEYLVNRDSIEYGKNFCLAGDENVNIQSRKFIKKALFPSDWKEQVVSFYSNTTQQLLKQYSYQIAGVNQVDIVRDVITLANTHFSASVFSLPLKTKAHPEGVFTEQELYMALSVLFISIFYDADPEKSFMLKNGARTIAQLLGEMIQLNVEMIGHEGLIADLIARLHAHTRLSDYGTHMIQRLLESGVSIKQIVWTHLLPTAASMVANQAQFLATTLDYYLGQGCQHLEEINRLAKLDTTDSDDLIMRYFLEGARLSNSSGLLRDAVFETTIQDNDREVTIPAGRRVLINLKTASLDPAVFKDPLEVRLDRDIDSYIHYGWGPHQCVGLDTTRVASATMFREIMKLDNLRRAPGLQGQVKKLEAPYGFTSYMTSDWSSVFPLPTTMKVQWDGLPLE